MMFLREKNFSSTAIRPTEGKDSMQRQSNQTLKVQISRQNQLLQDGEVRHQNQLTGETFSERIKFSVILLLLQRGERS
jgi:hypothetical protein